MKEQEAGKSLDHLAVGQHNETGLFHGLYFRNKPTPSGCPRMLLQSSTTEGYKTEQEAAEAIEKHFPDLPKISNHDQPPNP